MGDDKTENPTPKRLRESREKGDICKSQDIPTAATVLAITGYLVANGSTIFEQMLTLMQVPSLYMHLPFQEALGKTVPAVLDIIFSVLMPVVALVMCVALVANIAQVGFLFSMEAAMPKMENLSPSKWFKKTFAMKNLVELLKNILKVAILAYAAWSVVYDNFHYLFKIPHGTIANFWSILALIIQDLLIFASGSFAAIAALDFLYQKWQYSKNHMMSKDEVKREYKEMEGDPQIKGKRKQLHQELVAQNSSNSVRKAKVLVTNPTHFAIALDYEKDKTPLPVILAKGEGYVAQRMIQVAKEEGIPIMRNVPLARELFENGAENSYIPKDLIKPVAEVLRWVQSLER